MLSFVPEGWLGWGPAHDSWEPEEHLAPELVASFREERAHKASHVGSDYLAGRKRMLWCASCAVHMPSDSFSANMRRADPATRSNMPRPCVLSLNSASSSPTWPSGARAERRGVS